MCVVSDAVVYTTCRHQTDDVVYKYFNCTQGTFIVIQSAEVGINLNCGISLTALICVKPVDDGGNILNQPITWCNGRQSCTFIFSKSSQCDDSSHGNYIRVVYNCAESKSWRHNVSQILTV